MITIARRDDQTLAWLPTLAVALLLVASCGAPEGEASPTVGGPAGAPAIDQQQRAIGAADAEGVHLMIAPRAFETELRRLQQFKLKTGVIPFLLFLEDIDAKYPGRDLPERVKRCIETHVKLYKARSAMLVGDADTFPVRYVTRYLESYTPSDLYYADLFKADGSFSSWDDNNNGVFGEMMHTATKLLNVDGSDFFPDIAVARVPVSSSHLLSRFVDKVISYERGQRHPGWPDAQRRVLLATGGWSNDTQVQDAIAQQHLAGLDVIKMYYPTVDRAATFDARVAAMARQIDRGVAFVNYLGHGSTNGFNWVFNNAHLGQLRNKTMPPIVFSSGCNTGGFAAVPPFHDYVDKHGVFHAGGSSQAKLAAPAPVQPSWCTSCRRDAGPEAWIAGERGAVGYVAPVGAGNAPYALDMSKYFFAAYANGAGTFGEMWRQMITTYLSKHANAHRDLVSSSHWHRKAIWNMLVEFNAFGDPALRVGGFTLRAERLAQSAHVGCYRDAAARDLQKLVAADDQMTVDRCLGYCSDAGFLYAGLQNGRQCFCGNSYGKHGTAASCSRPCTGAPSETCGGAWANDVYALSRGCFKDGHDRDLPHLAATAPTMSAEACIYSCRSKGYRYAGVQYGSQCYCGNDYGKHGPSKGCNMACAGNGEQRCGGRWANTVFPVTLGCYEKAGQSYSVPMSVLQTVPDCVSHCRAKGYRYSGASPSACYCSNAYDVDAPLAPMSSWIVPSHACDGPCDGAPHQICGGYNPPAVDFFPAS